MDATHNETLQDKVLFMSEHRKRIIDEYFKTHDEGFPEKADFLADQIVRLVCDNCDSFPLELIIESLTKLGHAPNIVYDDNGHFAVTGDGFQEMPQGDDAQDLFVSCMVRKYQWKPTIREALSVYLSDVCTK